jgi:hypothetical protein
MTMAHYEINLAEISVGRNFIGNERMNLPFACFRCNIALWQQYFIAQATWNKGVVANEFACLRRLSKIMTHCRPINALMASLPVS